MTESCNLQCLLADATWIDASAVDKKDEKINYPLTSLNVLDKSWKNVMECVACMKGYYIYFSYIFLFESFTLQDKKQMWTQHWVGCHISVRVSV